MITQALYVNEQLGVVESPLGTANIYSIDNPLYKKDMEQLGEMFGNGAVVILGIVFEEAPVLKLKLTRSTEGDTLNGKYSGDYFNIAPGSDLTGQKVTADLEPDRLYLVKVNIT